MCIINYRSPRSLRQKKKKKKNQRFEKCSGFKRSALPPRLHGNETRHLIFALCKSELQKGRSWSNPPEVPFPPPRFGPSSRPNRPHPLPTLAPLNDREKQLRLDRNIPLWFAGNWASCESAVDARGAAARGSEHATLVNPFIRRAKHRSKVNSPCKQLKCANTNTFAAFFPRKLSCSQNFFLCVCDWSEENLYLCAKTCVPIGDGESRFAQFCVLFC